jgi:hypothetical protein
MTLRFEHTTRHMKTFPFLLLLLFTVFNVNSQDTLSGFRDPWLWPFSPNSIWNQPIGSNAIYVDANFQAAGHVGVDIQHILELHDHYPVRQVLGTEVWGPGRCNGTQQLGFSIPVPDDWIVPDAGNSPYGLTPNSNFALRMPDPDMVFEGSQVSRCQVAGPVHMPIWMQYPNNRKSQSIRGDGLNGGGQGASGMSALGGTIRKGAFISPDPIRHALKINPWAEKYCFYHDTLPGYKWPAIAADSYAWDRYRGDDPNIVMGSLFAIPPDVTIESIGIQTIPGKKLFFTMQNYGVYFTEDAAWDVWDLIVERGVELEFHNAFGFTMYSNTWKNEVNKLMKALAVVTNNTPDQIGGGGEPLQPLAPPFCTGDECNPPASFLPVLKSDSTSWVIAEIWWEGIIMSQHYALKHPDSLYAKLYRRGESESIERVREDTISGKLWYVLTYPETEEKLMMDLTLDVGDTFDFTGRSGTVDSVYFLDDGRKIIIFDLLVLGENVRFIEGVGPNTGVIPHFAYYVTCKYDNDELVYMNSNSLFEGCFPPSYQPVLSGDSIRWNVLRGYCDHFVTVPVRLKGDTLINLIQYSVIDHHYEDVLIREDALNGKLWYRSKSRNRDLLIMDLSLEVDDVFYVHRNDDSVAFYVDSVYYKNNRKHIRLNGANIIHCVYIDTLTFIEGVGPNASFLLHDNIFSFTEVYIDLYVLCMYRDGELIHINSYYSDKEWVTDPCRIFGTSIEKVRDPGSGISIYPNPASDVLHVEIDPSLLPSTEIVIYNIQGVALKHLHLQGYNHTINTGGLNKGLYFVSIKNGSHRLLQKIIIN